ncbi:uncharacterized protein LOC114169284 isoform X1 [Vigna unguiculata]|uniref:uncharacterized protein LOC114169284 isoform X1 n=1 Tax=Vigna unguiculata TaxID=3917 RepID=UPI0010169A74|nr:uncharacterized protein LOC114169284 isoform X1 [Vigna unguiculata]
MRRKSVGKRRDEACATAPSLFAIPLLLDEHNATAFDSESDDVNCVHRRPEPGPEFVESLDRSICVCCDDKREEGVLVCSERLCPVTVHSNCIGSEPKFNDSGNFYCPYCWYKRALDTCQQLREKSLVAKKALSHFLESGARADSAVARADSAAERAGLVQDGIKCVEETQYEENNDTDEEKVSVSVTVSSVGETNDEEPNVVSAEKRKNQRKDPSARRKGLLQQEEHKHCNTRRKIDGNVKEEEVTSSRRPQRSIVKGMNRTSLPAKRKRLLWTVEEEKVLKEGVLKFSQENKNIPWRKILEFGCRVFDKTRTPIDLKDKWKSIISKKGYTPDPASPLMIF